MLIMQAWRHLTKRRQYTCYEPNMTTSHGFMNEDKS